MQLQDTIKVFNHSNAAAPVFTIYVEGEEAKRFMIQALRRGIATMPTLPPYAASIDELTL